MEPRHATTAITDDGLQAELFSATHWSYLDLTQREDLKIISARSRMGTNRDWLPTDGSSA